MNDGSERLGAGGSAASARGGTVSASETRNVGQETLELLQDIASGDLIGRKTADRQHPLFDSCVLHKKLLMGLYRNGRVPENRSRLRLTTSRAQLLPSPEENAT